MPIIGIVAAGGLLNIAGGNGIIVGPTLINFDFINEIYEVNGSPTTAAAIITTPGDVGVSGLNIPLLGTPNTILGDAATILLTANWTIAIEFESLSTSGNLHLFSLAETPIVGFRDLFQCGYPSSPNNWWTQDDDQAFTPRNCFIGTKATGIHQMAITRTDGRLILAVDGVISLASTASKTLDELDVATFGGPAEDTNGREANILSFAAYEPQADNVLVALSGGVYVPPISAVGSAAGLGSASGVGQVVGGTISAVGSAAGAGVASGVGVDAAAPVLWTPAEIATLLWYDASDVANFTLGGGNAVSQWNDLSGAGNHLTPSSGSGVIWDDTTNTIGGLPVVSWDSSDGGKLRDTSVSNLPANSTGWTTVCVVRTRETGQEFGLYDFSSDGTTRAGLAFMTTSITVRGGDPSHEASQSIGSGGAGHVISTRNQNTDRQSWFDGVPGTNAATNKSTRSVAQVMIGCTFSDEGSNTANAEMGEFVAISGDDPYKRQVLEGYMAWKWGGSLESKHPFKNAAPAVSAPHAYTASASSGTDLTTFTFAAQPIGTAAANRRVIVGTVAGASNVNVSSMTIGGVSATLVKRQEASSNNAEIWIANVPTGTTGDVVVTWGAAQGRCGIAVWVANLASDSPVDTDGGVIADAEGAADITLTTQAGGFVVGIGYEHNLSLKGAYWNNMAQRNYDFIEGTSWFTAGDLATTGTSLVVGLDRAGVGTGDATQSPWAVASF